MKKTKVVALLLVLLMMMSLMSACGATKDTAKEPVEAADQVTEAAAETVGESVGAEIGEIAVAEGEGTYERKTEEGTLTVGIIRNLSALNPGNNNSVAALSLVYDKLFVLNTETGEYEPRLATEWSYDDETSLHIWLRDDVQWSNGEPFTAEDVLFTVEYLATKSTRAIENFRDYDIENSEIINDHELILRTKTVDGAQIANLASNWAYMLNKNHVESTDDDAFWEDIVGTGAFLCESNVAGEKATFTANPNYWGEAPDFDEVTIRYYSDTATMFMDYETGALDLVLEPTDLDLARVTNGEVDHTIYTLFPQMRVVTLVMYDKNEFLSDVAVREAIAHAIDVDAVAYAGWGDLAVVPTGFLPEGCNYRLETGAYEYNPELAKQVLAEAGYTDGQIQLTTVYGTAEPSVGVACEALQAMLAEVGIGLTIECYDQATMTAMIQGTNNNGVPEVELSLFSNSITTRDPSLLYNLFKSDSSLAICANSDEYVNKLIVDAVGTNDSDERASLYADLQQYLYDNFMGVPVAETFYCAVARDYIDADSLVAIGDCASPNLTMIEFVD